MADWSDKARVKPALPGITAGIKQGSKNYPSPNDIRANNGQMIYNNPHWTVSGTNIIQGDPSSIGDQINLYVYMRQALIDLEKVRFFTQLAKVYRVPANSGKVVKKNHYLPVLDDRNVAGGGIGPDGKAITGTDGKAGGVGSGNLYSSSKDISKIVGKLPTLTEVGGRVNRIGFTRTTLEATAFRLGFFYEWTQEAMDFDTDEALLANMGRESMRAAREIQEDMIAIDLIKQCPNIFWGGAATQMKEMTAEQGQLPSIASYSDLERLELMLRENRAPHRLACSTGSVKLDTRVIGSGYALYVGYPMYRQLKQMRDHFDEPAFISYEKYAQGDNLLNGEIGSIAGFRIVLVPEMPEYNAAGAECTDPAKSLYRVTPGYAENTNNTDNTDSGKSYYDVHPMLVVSSDAFTCLGFTGGYGGLGDFMMKTTMPGLQTMDDPYGETGRTSIKWSYGMLIERPEWMGLILSLGLK